MRLLLAGGRLLRRGGGVREAGGDDGDGDFPVHGLVDEGAEDDVGVHVHGLVDDFRRGVDLKCVGMRVRIRYLSDDELLADIDSRY